MRHRKCVVAHSLKSWLPQTEVWQFNQIASLPSDVFNLIVCDHVVSFGKFEQPENATIKCLRKRIPLRNLPQYVQASSRFHPTRLYDKCTYYLQGREQQMFLAMQIKKQGAGVVHSHFGNRGWLNARVARKAKVKHIVSFYGSDLGFLPRRYPEWRFRYKQLFRSVDAVLAEGPHMANLIMQLGCPKEKVMVHHLGVKVDEIGFRPRHKSATEPFSVLIAASFREKKGIVYAVEALKRVNHIHPIIVTIVGNDNGTPQSLKEKEKIMKVINSEENFKIRVRLTGYLGHHELIEEAYKHHVFVSPSVTASDGDIEGGAPVTLIEMAATGIAVVSTRHCDIPGVIQNGKSGFLVDERDVDGLVDCLIWLNDNPGEWGRIANEARSHIEREYNALTQGERLACIYKELAGA